MPIGKNKEDPIDNPVNSSPSKTSGNLAEKLLDCLIIVKNWLSFYKNKDKPIEGIEKPEVPTPQVSEMPNEVPNNDTTLSFERRIGKNSEFKTITFEKEKLDSVIENNESNNFKIMKR